MTQGFNPAVLLMPTEIHNLPKQPVSLHGCSHSESWTVIFVVLVLCFVCFLIVKSTGFVSIYLKLQPLYLIFPML